MKARMEKAGLNVEGFFRDLLEGPVSPPGDPRKSAVLFVSNGEKGNVPRMEDTSRTQDTHCATLVSD